MSGTRTSTPADPGRGGSIYDLGYRGYEGPREGRRGAVAALVTHSLRTAYGLGRNARSKVAPFGLLVMATLPSLLMVGIFAIFVRLGDAFEAAEAITTMAGITYASLFPMTGVLVFLFCAAQAPELFGRDQQSGVLPLYFSRATTRLDYATARFLGLFFSLLIVVMAPQVILFVGRVLVADDPVDSFWTELQTVPVMFVVGLFVAGLVGSSSSAIASLTPRRAYATVGIVALYLVPFLTAGVLVFELDAGVLGQVAVLLSPSDVLDGLNAYLFDSRPENAASRADIEGWVYLAATIAWIAISLAILGWRYRTIDT